MWVTLAVDTCLAIPLRQVQQPASDGWRVTFLVVASITAVTKYDVVALGGISTTTQNATFLVLVLEFASLVAFVRRMVVVVCRGRRGLGVAVVGGTEIRFEGLDQGRVDVLRQFPCVVRVR